MSTDETSEPAAAQLPTFIINLNSTDVDAAAAFYVSLTFTFLDEWCDGKTKALRLPAPNHNILLMLHHTTRFQELMRKGTDVVDAHQATEALFSFCLEKREQVDGWLGRAVAAGGQSDPFQLEGYGESMGMYTRSFADLDGHIWEACCMLPGQACGSAQPASSEAVKE